MDQKKRRAAIRTATFEDEQAVLDRLVRGAQFSAHERERIAGRGADLVRSIRDTSDPSIMELFLGQYGLSSEEGVALMCLAEALLRVPDNETIDELIEDKIVPSAWGEHLGRSHSPLINASTWALMLTGRVLDEAGEGITGTLRSAIKRLGEPVIRSAVAQAMREMGRQFVLGEDITKAMRRAEAQESKGFTYSYDMLGEAARTEADASRYHVAYAQAISEIATAATADDIAENPGISIKLSALHPRYEPLKHKQVMEELVPRVASLVALAKSAGIGLNIDAEEADRLDLSLDVIEAVLSDPSLDGWDGFGVVVQAYSKRAGPVIDWLYDRAVALDRRIMVRLVKGAYWDTEIKHAQVEGLPGFPVFTRKAATDVSYMACARKLFDYADRIYPQFATHNAHSVASVLEIAPNGAKFEFQRLHGMGEALHARVLEAEGTRCRIYAPVGAHRDLLAYLVRRLLENGANSSFVNQIVDETVSPDLIAADPIAALESQGPAKLRMPSELYLPDRSNSNGIYIADPDVTAGLIKTRQSVSWDWGAVEHAARPVLSPATGAVVGHVEFQSADEATAMVDQLSAWDAPVGHRAEVLRQAAQLYQDHSDEFFALLAQEAGKTLNDCIGELREAIDFLRFYAAEAQRRSDAPRGVFACISPWNFPLAIFTGQIAAALATGNGVAAKPAEATSLIASRAVALLHEAGVPKASLALVLGDGGEVGPALCAHHKVAGVAFTGSTATGQAINRALASRGDPDLKLVAETGGINAMIVDSTALLEQAAQDIISSAFQSAGQRCSALRILYVQSDIEDALLEMLSGAMDTLLLGDPSDFATDIGPVIDAGAKSKIDAYVQAAKTGGRLIKQLPAPVSGHFVGPAMIRVSGIADLAEEIFGPVLHVASFEVEDLDGVIDAINASGYGLTFGLHSRIDGRVQHIVDRVDVGNIYVNRNQIGAVVGSQPFGGHGLSGTGPKAGGVRYLDAFCISPSVANDVSVRHLPGPTGEDNSYLLRPLHGVLCAGPGKVVADQQARLARELGCQNVVVRPGATPDDAAKLPGIHAVLFWGDGPEDWVTACAARTGPIVKLVRDASRAHLLMTEQTICVDTTASGGNAELLAESE